VHPEFLECGKYATGEVGAAGSRHIPQCTNDRPAIRGHRLCEFAPAIEADDTDFDVTPRREVFDQPDSTCRTIVLGVRTAQARRRIHDKHHVEVLHATDRRRDALHFDRSLAIAGDEIVGR
jgi:hypothetical protein